MSMNNITHIVVHYSATFEDQNLTVKDIDAMHRARGWKGVGYHYVIRRDGVVEKGRPDNVVGAHVGGQNSGKIGICAIGGVNHATGPDVGVDNRTPAQIKAQIALIKTLLSRYPKAKVVGHRDLAPTQCPGFDVIPWWASVMKGGPAPMPDALPIDPGKVVVLPPDNTPDLPVKNRLVALLLDIIHWLFGRK
jgi:N-acetylmuramoyl-L-alanine amidase